MKAPQHKTKNSDRGHIQEYVSAAGFQIFKVSGLIFLMSFVYLLVVYFGQNIRNIGTMKPEDQLYFSNALKYVLFVCRWSGCIAVISSAIAFFMDYAYGRGVFVLGAAFRYGLPWLMYYYTPAGDFQRVIYYWPGEAAPHYYLNEFTALYTNLGYIMLAVGIVLLLRELILEIRDTYKKSRITGKRIKTRKRTDLGFNVHCWDTNFCSPEIKKICPAFAAKKSCWKIGTGCCDESLVLTLLADKKNKYSDRLKELMNPHTQADTKKGSCSTCHIYMAHQKYKYRIWLPIVVVLSLGTGYLCYKPLYAYFQNAIAHADRFASFLVSTNHTSNIFQLHGFVIFAVAIAVFALAAAGVALLNYIIFKLKL